MWRYINQANSGIKRHQRLSIQTFQSFAELLEQAMTGTYGFCSARDCPVVYFQEGENHRFTIGDVRVRVGVKVKHDPIPLCYCFGFNESHIRDEISRAGDSTIPERISRLI